MSATAIAHSIPQDNNALLMSMNSQLGILNERTENTRRDVAELKAAFEAHRSVTEARANGTGEKLAFLKGEWKAWLAIVLVAIEHFWPKGAGIR
jgi:hypothetical protein